MSDRPVRRLILSQLAFSTGVFLQAAIIGKQVYDITDRELDLGLLGLAEFLPAVALVLVTGAVADRFDRRRVAAIGLFGELVCSLGLLFYARSNPTAVWPIFVIAVLFGASRSFIAPAARALPPMVAPDGELPRVIALNTGAWTAAIIVGPAASGALYAIDPWVAYAASAVLIASGMVGIWGLPIRRRPAPPDPDERPSLHSAMEGLRFIRRTPILFAAIALDLFAVLFGGAIALAAGDRRRSARRRRRRLRVAPSGGRHRRGEHGRRPGVAADHPARGDQADGRGRGVRLRDHGPRRDHQLRRCVRGDRRAQRSRHDQRVHPLDARPAGHPGREARPRSSRSRTSSSVPPTSSGRSRAASSHRQSAPLLRSSAAGWARCSSP